MPNVLKISVENPEELLNVGMYDTGALIQIQSGSAAAGPFSDLAGTGSTPTIAIVSGTRAYTGYDPAGASATWYQTRYKNAGGTRTSDWSSAFQVGAEEAGLICSIYDCKQALGIAASDITKDEDLLDLIVSVTDEFETVTGRDFTGDKSDVTFQMHTMSGRDLWLPRGLQSVTTLGVATTNQPSTGGTYTTKTDFWLEPPDYMRDPYWPATYIRFPTTGSYFYDAAFGAQITGKRGFAKVPPRIARMAVNVVSAMYTTGGKVGPRVAIGPEGATVILRDISPADWDYLMAFAAPRVASGYRQ